eukprot:13937698-Alexandrium_andersonii.AAC.1
MRAPGRTGVHARSCTQACTQEGTHNFLRYDCASAHGCGPDAARCCRVAPRASRAVLEPKGLR